MSVVTSFRIVYTFSRVFGFFPYKPFGAYEFRVNKSNLVRMRYTMMFLLITRPIIIYLDSYNILKYKSFNLKTFMIGFRTVSILWLLLMAMIVYYNVSKYSRPICLWLNRMHRLYSYIHGNVRIVLTTNRFMVFYSLIFFWAVNLVSITSFWINGKFIQGWLGLIDSIFFIIMLLIQNLYICQFVTFVSLARYSFQRINEIIQDEKLRFEKGRGCLRKLQQLRAKHLEITTFFEFLNGSFQLYILMYVSWAFFSTMFCSMSIVILDLDDAITMLFWMFYNPCQSFPIMYVCQSTLTEAKKSVQRLQELLINDDNFEIKEEIEVFSLQLQHHPVNFNVCGLFDLDFRLVCSVTGVIATYVFALVQIQPPSITERNGTLFHIN